MENKDIDSGNGKKNRKKIAVFFVLAVVLGALTIGGFYGIGKFFPDKAKKEDVLQVKSSDQPENKIVNENSPSLKKEQPDDSEIDEEEAQDEKMLKSENYKISNINIGGSMVVLPNEENETLNISNIKSSSFIDGKKNEIKLVVSWETNKLAASELEYAKSDGSSPRMVKESSYGFSHSVIIAGLNPGTPYIYRVKCKDRWGNDDASDYFGAYTASKPVSVVDLIFGEMKKMFGWATK